MVRKSSRKNRMRETGLDLPRLFAAAGRDIAPLNVDVRPLQVKSLTW
jgi:hypothetical protein